MLNVASFLVLSVPVTCSAKSPSAVVLGQSSTLALCVGRALTDDFHGEKPSMSNPRTLVILGVLLVPCALIVQHVATTFMKQNAEMQIHARDLGTQSSAVSSLLGLTCDAVVELDSELKFVSESVQLATMLLHRPGASMQGMKLTDFIAAPDVARAEEVLSQHPSDDVTAHAFHTHLVDSCSSKFRTEIFQATGLKSTKWEVGRSGTRNVRTWRDDFVSRWLDPEFIGKVRYTTMNGTPHHLLGLREFTDLKPLARADDPNPAGSPDWHDAGVTGEPTVGNEIVLDCSYKSLDSVSFPLIHSESEEETPVTEQVSSGVVEKRLEITKKDSFFNVDMKEQVVCAASAPFCSLVGLKLHAILGSSFASRMFQKLCEDARRFAKSQSAGEDDQVLPDQVAMFRRMPLLLGAQLVEISGVMKVMLSQSGDLQVIVSFARVESYRPSLGTGVAPEDFVDWPSLKQKAWDFVDRPYEGPKSLETICPAWWNATGCECDCANCSILFEQCPVGFMLFRSLSLLCGTKDSHVRLHELVVNKWGRGLLDLTKLRLGFADIIESGWPVFGVLARIGDQLRLDGLVEEIAARLGNGVAARQRELRDRASSSFSHAEASGPSMCEQRGWPEDKSYKEEVNKAVAEDRPVTLQASVDASSKEGACPLQLGMPKKEDPESIRPRVDVKSCHGFVTDMHS
ncbi:unnamed protein product [Durusdinium trenchii]|uniref:Uncharacterized protein n=1 Tax=Durusdinium trenchii TaxID=1381693 RepID=A0ABP0QA38_9DINO